MNWIDRHSLKEKKRTKGVVSVSEKVCPLMSDVDQHQKCLENKCGWYVLESCAATWLILLKDISAGRG